MIEADDATDRMLAIFNSTESGDRPVYPLIDYLSWAIWCDGNGRPMYKQPAPRHWVDHALNWTFRNPEKVID